jgi:hypothetical protein
VDSTHIPKGMGKISFENLLPEIFRPAHSEPIAAWRLPPATTATLIGFQRKQGEPIVYEGETPINVRLMERLWRFRYKGDATELTSSRWRLEIVVASNANGPLQPGHMLVVAQRPYANGWMQGAKFKKYSKKGERLAGELPAALEEDTDPVDWLERNIELDPWEQDKRYVSGISFPNGYWAINPRNEAGDFLFGACPDRDVLTAELLASSEIKKMLSLTERNKIVFAFPGNTPHLEPETIDERFTLMGLAIQQALAGPASLTDWTGHLVADFVTMRYRDHLNNFNRVVMRRRGRELPKDDDLDA